MPFTAERPQDASRANCGGLIPERPEAARTRNSPFIAERPQNAKQGELSRATRARVRGEALEITGATAGEATRTASAFSLYICAWSAGPRASLPYPPARGVASFWATSLGAEADSLRARAPRSRRRRGEADYAASMRGSMTCRERCCSTPPHSGIQETTAAVLIWLCRLAAEPRRPDPKPEACAPSAVNPSDEWCPVSLPCCRSRLAVVTRC